MASGNQFKWNKNQCDIFLYSKRKQKELDLLRYTHSGQLDILI